MLAARAFGVLEWGRYGNRQDDLFDPSWRAGHWCNGTRHWLRWIGFVHRNRLRMARIGKTEHH